MVLTDNKVALRQLELANAALVQRESTRGHAGTSLAKDGKFHPRVLTLGGDHTITLPLLRGVASVYGPVSVIHFDSHLDTWKPEVFGGAPSEQAAINHGTYFYWASQEGLIKNGSSIASIGFPSPVPSASCLASPPKKTCDPS